MHGTSPVTPTDDATTVPPKRSPRRSAWRFVVPMVPRSAGGFLKWIGTRILVWPVLFLVMLGLLQRWLIYHPHREKRIVAAQSGLPAGHVHDVAFATHDDLELRGWHFLPDGRTAADHAECDALLADGSWVVLYLHGNAGNRRLRATDCGDFRRLGMHVLLFDFRGYGDNPGSPTEASLVADARTSWNYAVARGVSPERILIYGESLGGGVATRLASELCAEGVCPGALVLKGTFSSLAEVGAHHLPIIPVGLLLVDRYDSAAHIRRVTCPVLSIHGALDDIVPIEFGRRLFEAAPPRSANGIEKQLVELPSRGHNDLSVIEFLRPIAALLERIAAASESDREASPTRIAP
ncbi:MAG: alpha/beta hydrolase [Planctomycetaceae bacterium]